MSLLFSMTQQLPHQFGSPMAFDTEDGLFCRARNVLAAGDKPFLSHCDAQTFPDLRREGEEKRVVRVLL